MQFGSSGSAATAATATVTVDQVGQCKLRGVESQVECAFSQRVKRSSSPKVLTGPKVLTAPKVLTFSNLLR
jgi:hypothetical protein